MPILQIVLIVLHSQNLKHSRSENLTDELIERIVEILDGWSEKLTWNKLIDEIEFRTKNRYTRHIT